MRSEVARLLPPDSITIASLDMETLRELPIARQLSFGRSTDFERFLDLAGFDPRRDIDRVTVASDVALGRRGESSLLIVEGRFGTPEAGLRRLLEPAGEHAGVHLYASGPPNQRQSFGFLDEGTLAIGTESRIRAAIERWQSPGYESDVARVALAQNGADVWASTLAPQLALAPHLDKIPGGGGPLQAIVDSMRTLSIRGAALPGSYQVELAFLCENAADAQSVADAAATLAALSAMASRKSRPEVAHLLGSIQVERRESEALLSVELTESQILQLRAAGLAASAH